MRKNSPAGALEAYEQLAPFYDQFTAHHDYDAWLADLLRISGHRDEPGRLLDLACGTGKSFLPLLERGWAVTAVEQSPAMLDLARDKCRKRPARFECADIRRLRRLGDFDLVWCLDDALNYLHDLHELRLAFEGFARNLAEGGRAVFDVSTLLTYRTFFASTESVRIGENTLTWQGLASSDQQAGALAEARLEISGGEGAATAIAVHSQRHFTQDRIVDALADAGLHLLSIWGHGLDGRFQQPLDERCHTKAIYVTCLTDQRERR